MPAEEAPQPLGQASALLRGPLVVSEVVRVHGYARLAQNGPGVVETRLWRLVGEGGFYEVIVVPADPVDAKAGQLALREAPVEVGGGDAGLLFERELVA